MPIFAVRFRAVTAYKDRGADAQESILEDPSHDPGATFATSIGAP